MSSLGSGSPEMGPASASRASKRANSSFGLGADGTAAAAAGGFEDSISRIQASCDSLVVALGREERGVKRMRGSELERQKREEERLAEREHRFRALSRRLELFVTQGCSGGDNAVYLNVGGQRFVTTRQTLLAVPNTVFSVLLSGRFDVETVDGAIHLDRDPTHFSYILNYLRSALEVSQQGGVPVAVATCATPAAVEEADVLEAIQSLFSLKGVPLASAVRIAYEAEFYGLEHLKTMARNCTSLVVSKEVDAPYSSISEAIAKAQPGERIVVFPGTYFESIVITKKVEVCGDGPRGRIVIVTTDGTPTATFDEDGGKLSNLSLREMSKFGVCTLDVKCHAGGRAVLEQCDLTTRQEANTVNVSGHATLELCRCRIHGAKGSAVQLRDDAVAVMKENEFVNVGFSAVQARHRARYTLDGNVVSDAAYGGVDANDDSRGVISNNSFSNCARGGIILHGRASTSITGNVIHRCEYGINSFPGSTITKLEHNRLYDNTVQDASGVDAAVQRGLAQTGEAAERPLSSTSPSPTATPTSIPQ
eukprot:Rhum_TRINITY_DN14186_c3_g2::Rhum_TRINITY_DN14186_c3_g2_i1::g.72931::m.72931